MRLLGKAVLTISTLGLAASASAQDVRNEGAGSRRDALDRMIFKPAPTDDLLAASDWIGDKPTAASLNGKPVLVFTFAEWYRPSHTAAMLGKRLKDQHPELVIIGVHDSEGAIVPTAASWMKLQGVVMEPVGAIAQQRRPAP